MDLLTYLREYEPQELVRVSRREYTTRTHDSLKISNGLWMWWSHGIGGKTALEYLTKVSGLCLLFYQTESWKIELTTRTIFYDPTNALQTRLQKTVKYLQ